MKTRLDFVSNSSSSSFVVLADENTPDIFKNNFLSFDEFYNQFFRRDVIEELEYSLMFQYIRSGTDIFDKITFMTAKEFAEKYIKLDNGVLYFSKLYPVLESDRKLIDELRVLFDKYDQLERLHVKIYRCGEINLELHRKANDTVYNIKKEYQDKMTDILDKMTHHFRNAIKNKMSDWNFWYNELDDDQESVGYKALHEDGVRWGRVFNNH